MLDRFHFPLRALAAAGLSGLLAPAVFAQSSMGTGCPGTSGIVPALGLRSSVKAGLPVLADVTGAPGTACFLLGGLNASSYLGLPLPLGLALFGPELSGCTLYQNPGVVLPFDLDAEGRAEFSLVGWPAGVTAFFQVWNLDLGFGPGGLGGFSPGYSATGELPSAELYPLAVFDTGETPVALESADFDGDGRMDIATVDRDSDTVSVLLSGGDYTFSTVSSRVGDGPVAIAAADFDGDGNIDVATAASFSDAIFVSLGNGDGSLGAAQPYGYLAGSEPSDLAAGDLNGDGRPDLVAVNRGTDNATVLIGSGTGSFTASTFDFFGGAPFGLELLDYDHDGELDLMVANGSVDRVSLLRGEGDGSFSLDGAVQTGSQSDSFAVGDIDLDGNLDLVVTRSWSPFADLSYSLGGGQFGPVELLDLIYRPRTVALDDFDGDGRLDLAYTHRPGFIPDYSPRLDVLPGLASGGFGAMTSHWAGDFAGPHLLEDLDADGSDDLVLARPEADSVAVLFGTAPAKYFEAREFAAGFSLRRTDFDADGLADLVQLGSLQGSAPGLLALRSDGTGGFEQPVFTPLLGGPFGELGVGDFDSDGWIDTVVTRPDLRTVQLRRGDGQGGFTAAGSFSTAFDPRAAELADLDGDGALDLLVWQNDIFATNEVYVEVRMGAGDGTFGPVSTALTAESVFGQKAGTNFEWELADMDQDGALDLVLSLHKAGVNLAWLPGDGSGGFGAAVAFAHTHGVRSLAVGDITLDGIPDIVCGGGSNEFQVTVYPGLGDGTFAAAVHDPLDLPAGDIALGDVDLDGALDVALAVGISPGGNLRVLRNDGAGALLPAEVLDLGFDKFASQVIVGDMDGDGAPELIGSSSQGGGLLPNGLLD